MSNITIAAINERLKLGLTAVFIESELGVAPVEKVKKSSLWTEEQYQDICDKLAEHIERNRRNTAAAPAKVKKTEPTNDGFDFGGEGSSSDSFDFGGDEPKVGDINGFDFGEDHDAEIPEEFSFT
jgi:hypothetical protein